MPSSALRVSAAWAEVAALLIYQEVAALRALPGQIHHRRRGFRLGLGADVLALPLQYPPDGIGAGEDSMSLLPGNEGAADAPEMLYYG